MLSELLARRAATQDPELQTLIQLIGTSAAAADTVLEGVRRYAEVLDWAYRPTRFDLSLAVKSAVTRLHVAIEDCGATVKFGPLPHVWGDMVQLTALFQELVANSLRFRSPEPPFIQIAAPDSDPAYWLITVADNGPGIQPSAMDRIFRPLGKASEHAGAGMGLAICRRIAETHGGEIAAIPRQQGAEIRLLLPR